MNLIRNCQDSGAGIKSRSQLKKYGFIMAAAFAVITCLLLLRGKHGWMYTAIPSFFFLLFALIRPEILAPVEKFWMKLAGVMGFIMTNILLFLVFVFAIIPTGLILRLLGKSQIRKGFKPGSSSSYWITVDVNGPSSRPEKPY